MSDYRKMVVIEQGEFLVVQDSAGNRVAFEDLVDASRCCNLDLTGKFSMNYEPEVGIFQDSRDPTVHKGMIPYQPYEALISAVAILQQRKEDPFYGVDPSQHGPIAMARNKELAKGHLEQALWFLRENEDRVARGLTAILSGTEVAELTAYLPVIQGEVDAPSAMATHTVAAFPAVAYQL